MKLKRSLYYILMYLPLLTTIIALPFLPDQIPAHYGSDGQITRWGSKFETLILPVFIILFGLFMLGMAKISAKQEVAGKNNEKVTIVTGILCLALFNAMTGYFLYTDFHKVENLGSVAVAPTQMIFGILGIFMMIVGNIMPKVKKNSVIGVRTPWSMKNEITWKKSQRFGGISFIISGVIILLVNFLTEANTCLIVSLIVLVIGACMDVLYSYQIAKRNEI